jgi:hypothetical protein
MSLLFVASRIVGSSQSSKRFLVEGQLRDHCTHSPDRKRQQELLTPIPGIGAAIRTLVHLAAGVLKTGNPFDEMPTLSS